MLENIDISNIATVISGFSTVVIAILTCLLIIESKKTREETKKENVRPLVVTYLAQDKRKGLSNLFNIILENCGKGTAHNVKFTFLDNDRNIIKKGANKVADIFFKKYMFENTIGVLGVNQKIKTHGFSALNDDLIRYDNFEENRENIFTIKIDYTDVYKNKYTNEISIDLNNFIGLETMDLVDNTMKDFLNEAKKLNKAILDHNNLLIKKTNKNI